VIASRSLAETQQAASFVWLCRFLDIAHVLPLLGFDALADFFAVFMIEARV
jgi:hypothetical protein